MTIKPLEQVQEHQRLAESFGCHGWIWAGCFLVIAMALALPGKGPTPAITWELAGGSGLIGLLLAAWEIRRRGRRVILVPDGAGIAVYRKGRHAETLPSSEIIRVEAGLLVMLKVGIGLAAAGLAFTWIGAFELLRGSDRAGGLAILALGLACLGSLASAAWTRFACTHLRLPVREGPMVQETVLVRSGPFRALFP